VRDLEPHFAAIDPADAPEVLARHVADAVKRLLADERDPDARVALVNELVGLLQAPDERVVDGLQQLVALSRAIAPGTYEFQRPSTPLSSAALLTNGPDEPTLGAELRAELSSADRVDLLCAFIRWHGLRVLEDQLLALRARGIAFRVITTTYVGATERRAVDELVRRFGADVRITYETQSTRLHAKAWLIRRNSGFDTAFVGSSNLSRSALVDGLEWNVRLSGVATPELLRKFAATFDTYWADPGFVLYDPDTGADRLDEALSRSGSRAPTAEITLSGLEVRPLPHQAEILEALEAERELHDRHSNLVVAATGAGKTVVAALDYRRLREQHGRDLRLLFVAHRQEILQPSLRMYREVLSNGSFGELYVAGYRPDRWDHVFADATVQQAKLEARGTGAAYLSDVNARYLGALADFEQLRRFIERDPEFALPVLTSKRTVFQQRLIDTQRELIEEQMHDAGYVPPLDPSTLAYVLVRIGESFIFADLITGSVPDIDKAVQASRVLLHATPLPA